jgi:hypothetical protein
MKLRTFEGERMKGKLTNDYPISKDGLPVLLVDDVPFDPAEADFFLESATEEEMEQLADGGYDLSLWEEPEESEELEDEDLMEDGSDDS